MIRTCEVQMRETDKQMCDTAAGTQMSGKQTKDTGNRETCAYMQKIVKNTQNEDLGNTSVYMISAFAGGGIHTFLLYMS